MSATLLQTSDLKRHAGKILAAAIQRPQFIVRDGRVFKLTRVELPVEPRTMPVGYFNEPVDDVRARVEKAFSRIKQTPER